MPADEHTPTEEWVRWVTTSDPLDILDRGWEVLWPLLESTQPAALLAMIDRFAGHEPQDVVCALFALLIDRGWHLDEPPPEIAALNRAYSDRTLERLRTVDEPGK